MCKVQKGGLVTEIASPEKLEINIQYIRKEVLIKSRVLLFKLKNNRKKNMKVSKSSICDT